MKPQANSASSLESRIARRTDRIARWDREAGEVETSWTGGAEYRKFCEGMARSARATKADLEAALKHIKGDDTAVGGMR
jgi:hypothetical protein